MAGRRKTPAGQPTPPGGPTPTQRSTRLQRRRERMVAERAEAPDATGRLAVAFDYLRGAAARHQPNPARVDQLLDELADRLIAAADQVLVWQSRERTDTSRPTHSTRPADRAGATGSPRGAIT